MCRRSRCTSPPDRTACTLKGQGPGWQARRLPRRLPGLRRGRQRGARRATARERHCHNRNSRDPAEHVPPNERRSEAGPVYSVAGQRTNSGVGSQFVFGNWSGRRDLNPRPPVPQTGALPGCATPRPSRESTRGPSWLRSAASPREGVAPCRRSSGRRPRGSGTRPALPPRRISMIAAMTLSPLNVTAMSAGSRAADQRRDWRTRNAADGGAERRGTGVR